MRDFSRVRIENITKRFGEKVALHEFSLELNKGEFVTFLGPSGCGKSTALNCVTGLLPLSSGQILIDDECIDGPNVRVPPEKRQFGLVFQNYALFPHLNVYKNVAFGLQLQKLNPKLIKEKVTAALKLVHLEGFESKFPGQMSGGEQQRLAIARCVVMEPRLLLLDEPLSNLDAKLRIEMRYELKSIHNRLGVTTIYVTHDQSEALALSDKIVVMRHGKIQQIGSPEKVYTDPANLFVADFMGFKNIWPAKITALKTTGSSVEASVQVRGVSITAKLKYPEGDPRRAGIIKAYESQAEVKTAIRPEDIRIGTGPGFSAMKAKVQVVEYLGQSSLVSASMDDETLIDFKTEQSVRNTEVFELGIPEDKTLLFAADSE